MIICAEIAHLTYLPSMGMTSRADLLIRQAGVDSAWNQEKLEVRKNLKMAQNPTCPVHTVLDRSYLTTFYLEKQEADYNCQCKGEVSLTLHQSIMIARHLRPKEEFRYLAPSRANCFKDVKNILRRICNITWRFF